MTDELYVATNEENRWTDVRAKRDGHIIGSFPDPKDAQTHLDWLNAGSPMPKFKVGDRVQCYANINPPTVHIVEEVSFMYRGRLWAYEEQQLEPAPPEPRAKVRKSSVEDGWYVECAEYPDTGKWYKTEWEAILIRDALNANPSLSL